MKEQQYNFTPLGDEPTVSSIMGNCYKLIIILAIFVAIVFVWGPPALRQNLILIAFFICIAAIIYWITVTSNFIIKIQIDKINNKFYSYYITGRGVNGTTVIDLVNAKVDYKFYRSKGAAYWILTIADDVSSVKLMQGYQLTNGKNTFSKEQLDEINRIITSV